MVEADLEIVQRVTENGHAVVVTARSL
jgi:hypothetical protein